MFNSTISNQTWIAPNITIECRTSKHIGIYVAVLFSFSLLFNLKLIWIMLSNKKELLDSGNILILVLTILSLIGTVVELPFVAIAAFKCQYLKLKL